MLSQVKAHTKVDSSVYLNIQAVNRHNHWMGYIGV